MFERAGVRLRTRVMTRVAACVAVMAMACGAGAATAGTISQSKVYSITGAGLEGANWQKFDPANGVLTGITLGITSTSSGTFSITNLNASAGNPIDVQDPMISVSVNFSGLGSPAVQATSTIVTTNPSTASAYRIPSLSGAAFFALDPASQAGSTTVNPSGGDLFSYASYFTGSGFLTSNIAAQNFMITSTDPTKTLANVDGLTTAGTVTLTYSYVPEIDPAALGGGMSLLLGTLGLMERRHRRRRA